MGGGEGWEADFLSLKLLIIIWYIVLEYNKYMEMYPPKGAAKAEPKVVQLFLLMFYLG